MPETLLSNIDAGLLQMQKKNTFGDFVKWWSLKQPIDVTSWILKRCFILLLKQINLPNDSLIEIASVELMRFKYLLESLTLLYKKQALYITRNVDYI